MKKALLVGINYSNSQNPLRGCVNDIIAINSMLVNNMGFNDPKQIRMLTESSATTSNILNRLEWLVSDAKPGDVLYFHYSGHGSRVVDLDYDLMEEPDGMDEIICPYDLDWREKIIKDDDLKRIFNKVHPGVNLTVTLDCCHSGQGLRDMLPPLEIRDDILGPNRERRISMPIDIENRAYGLELEVKPRLLQSPHIIHIEDQSGLLISGCKSDQTSADAWFQGTKKYYGALTYFMINTLHKNKFNMNYTNLLSEVSNSLDIVGFQQQPELNGNSTLFDKQFLQPFT